MPHSDLLLLAAPGPSTNIIYNGLRERFGQLHVVMEQPVSRRTLLAGRVRRLGYLPVLSQLAFLVLLRPLLERGARDVVENHCLTLGLDRRAIPDNAVIRVPSVNSDQCREALRELAPRLIVVNGTRIISPETLRAAGVQLINIHAGITPRYRGVHGGYWALWSREPEHCGLTLHLVDAGIDTGNVLRQARIAPGPADNFASYPYLQLAAAMPILFDCVARGLNGNLVGVVATGPSRLWHHPGIWQYISGWLRGVR